MQERCGTPSACGSGPVDRRRTRTRQRHSRCHRRHTPPPRYRDALLGSGDLTALEGWNVLVKGARPYGFERVSDALEANPHATVLDLDLGRLAHNLQRFRDRFNKPIMGMVKAFAYGAGDAVAVELDRLGIDRLAVAFTEEGIALSKRGVRCPILVLNADAPALRRPDSMGP